MPSSVLACRGYPKPMQDSSLSSSHPKPKPLSCPACWGLFLCFSPLPRSQQGFATAVSLRGHPSDAAGPGRSLGMRCSWVVLQWRRGIWTGPGHCAPPFSSLSPLLALSSLPSPLSFHYWSPSLQGNLLLLVLSISLSVNYLPCVAFVIGNMLRNIFHSRLDYVVP